MSEHLSSLSKGINSRPSLADQACAAYTNDPAGSRGNIFHAYLHGEFEGEEQKILPIIEAEAEKGSPVAQSILGEILFYGLGKPKDIKKSIFWLEKAAEQRDGKAMYLLATVIENENPQKALFLYVDAFHSAIVESELALGRFCENGKCGPKNLFLAGYFYRRAYKNGLERAKKDYDRITAELGEENLEKYIKNLFKNGAFPDILMLAEAGDSKNQYELGKIYMEGVFTPKNYKVGLEWLEKSAAQNFFRTPYLIGKAYYLGEGVEKDFQKAAEWFHKGAELEHNEAAYALGCLYQEGEGVEKNIDLARYWYQKAINAKSPPNESHDLGAYNAEEALEKLNEF